jgi:hypothetical protein
MQRKQTRSRLKKWKMLFILSHGKPSLKNAGLFTVNVSGAYGFH